jgi:hypothetical protein
MANLRGKDDGLLDLERAPHFEQTDWVRKTRSATVTWLIQKKIQRRSRIQRRNGGPPETILGNRVDVHPLSCKKDIHTWEGHKFFMSEGSETAEFQSFRGPITRHFSVVSLA